MLAEYAQHARPVRIWIWLCLALVIAMVFIGGVTRLTESGLSIVEWKLISGILPPLSHNAWQEEFDAYQNSPEFQKVNAWMSVEDFKRIFWLEYLHRLLGRLTGLVFLLPWLVFGARRMLSPAMHRRMAVAVVLVALQGAVGWIMVKSGLEVDPRVHPLKLSMHLMLAIALASLLTVTLHQLYNKPGTAARARPFPIIRLFLGMLTVQIIVGAWVAGLDAGKVYNSFPFMDGDLLPSDFPMLEPWYRNIYENVVIVQFVHRWLGVLLVLGILQAAAFLWFALPGERMWIKALSILVCCQFMLGVYTLIHAVPLAAASLHQMIAVALFLCLLSIWHRLRKSFLADSDRAG